MNSCEILPEIQEALDSKEKRLGRRDKRRYSPLGNFAASYSSAVFFVPPRRSIVNNPCESGWSPRPYCTGHILQILVINNPRFIITQRTKHVTNIGCAQLRFLGFGRNVLSKRR